MDSAEWLVKRAMLTEVKMLIVNPFIKSKQLKDFLHRKTTELNKIYLHYNDPFTLMLFLLEYRTACCTCILFILVI